jgi:hypothetical protein
VVTIVAQLVFNIDQNEDKTGEPNGQSQNVDDRVKLVLPQVAKGNRQVISKHFSNVLIR